MMKSDFPPARVRSQFKIQEIKLFEGYENVARSSPIVFRKKYQKKKHMERATCLEIIVYFVCVFVAATIITGIIASHFKH